VKGEFEFKPPKTRTSRRTINLPGMIVEALREQYEAHLEERLPLGMGRDPRALVFSRPSGEPLDPDTLSKSFGRLITAAKVTRITFHGQRHTYISHLLMDGVRVKVVSERAGGARQREHHATPTPPTSSTCRLTRRCGWTHGFGRE
jgi:integrase